MLSLITDIITVTKLALLQVMEPSLWWGCTLETTPGYPWLHISLTAGPVVANIIYSDNLL